MKFRKCDRIPEKSGVLLAQPCKRGQIGSLCRIIPLGCYLRESMLRSCLPENVLAAIVIGDEGMLQGEPIGDGAYARSFESSFGKFSDSGIQNRGPCVKSSVVVRLSYAAAFGVQWLAS